MSKVALPSGLQSLTFVSNGFGEVDSASGLQSWTLDASFNRGLELGKVTLPCGLQSSTFDANR